MPDLYDNIYNIWSATHSPDQCIWRGEARRWEQTCNFQADTNTNSIHWRCSVCGQQTGNEMWNSCPYSDTIEHILGLTYLKGGASWTT